MEDSTVFQNILIPAIMVVAGIFLLILSIAPPTVGRIKLSGKQKIVATATGIILLLFAIISYPSPGEDGDLRFSSVPTIMGITIRNSRENGNIIIYERINYYDEDGNTSLVERNVTDLSDPSQRQYINVQSSAVNDPPEIQKIRSSITTTWSCGGLVYGATVEVTLVDSDGNRSKPVRYRIDCNEE